MFLFLRIIIDGPIVTHGRTLTSKIPLKDVLEIIKVSIEIGNYNSILDSTFPVGKITEKQSVGVYF